MNEIQKVLEDRAKAVKRLQSVPFIDEQHRFYALASFLSIEQLNEVAEQWERSQ